MKSGVSLCPAVTSMGAPLTPIKYVEGTTTTGSDYCQGLSTCTCDNPKISEKEFSYLMLPVLVEGYQVFLPSLYYVPVLG